jgi:hypothetical protein
LEQVFSALHLKADLSGREREARFVPTTVIETD